MTAPFESEKAMPPGGYETESTQVTKGDAAFIEGVDVKAHASYADAVAARISEQHRDYLLQRHGTLDLDPVPSMDPADPFNWPTWKKLCNLLLVAFHACMGTFIAAGIIPAYGTMAEEFGITLQKTSYLTSLQIAILGGAPLFWKPLSNRFGRRPIFLLSLILSLVCNVGCAKSPDYASMAACRALTAFFISPASAIGSAVVTETFFKKDRARYMGIWTLLLTLGIPLAPFLFGFVAYRVGYRWIFWILAIANGVQFILYLFLGPETRYLPNAGGKQLPPFRTQYLSLRRIDPTPFTWYEFVRPLTFVIYPSIAIPSAAYAMVFIFGNILSTVQVPQLLEKKFELNTEQLGLQFLGLIIGAVLGEQVGGTLSDLWMKLREKRIHQKPSPEFRLWLSYLGYILAIAGVIVFLVCTQEAPAGRWTVSPIIGTALGAGGNQVVTTVLVTYAVDCYPDESASIGVFVTFVRQIWGFLGPFWFTPMFEAVGIAASSGICCALIVAVSVIPTILLQWKGKNWRPATPEY